MAKSFAASFKAPALLSPFMLPEASNTITTSTGLGSVVSSCPVTSNCTQNSFSVPALYSWELTAWALFSTVTPSILVGSPVVTGAYDVPALLAAAAAGGAEKPSAIIPHIMASANIMENRRKLLFFFMTNHCSFTLRIPIALPKTIGPPTGAAVSMLISQPPWPRGVYHGLIIHLCGHTPVTKRGFFKKNLKNFLNFLFCGPRGLSCHFYKSAFLLTRF